jgi:thioesterase domain-containing protein
MEIDFSYIETAREEMREKSIEDIQIDTAKKWAARAYVAFEIAAYLGEEDKDNAMMGWLNVNAINWFNIGEECRRKALEHVALVEDFEKSDELVKAIHKLLGPIRDSAIESAYGVRSEVVTEVEEETLTEEDIEEASQQEEGEDKKE